MQDSYGLSWQVVPDVLEKMILDGDPMNVKRVTAALLKMRKFDIELLKSACEGR